MDIVYWVSFIVGGFFVLLSILGGGDAHADADTDFDVDHDMDFDTDHDVDFDTDHDVEFDADADVDIHVGSGDVDMSPDFVDLFTIRALFLFAAFFGLTGVLLSLTNTGEPLTGILAALMGMVIGLGGNYVIKRIGYAHVSSNVSAVDLKGRTGQVIIPFDGADKGKISLVSKGQRLQLVARAFSEVDEPFEPGDEVVVVRVDGAVAEVVKPT
ncbi:MAG: hypothetical protein ACE5G0_20670 [Rhodothermales bacterium]